MNNKRNLFHIFLGSMLLIVAITVYLGGVVVKPAWQSGQENIIRSVDTNDLGFRPAISDSIIPRISASLIRSTTFSAPQKLSKIFEPDLQVIEGDKFVLGGIFTLREDETLNGSLFVLGGLAELDSGSRVNGDVVVLGGTTDVDGSVEGDVLVVGGLLDLGPNAVVEGGVSVLAGQFEQDPDAQVYGEVVSGIEGPFSISVPGDFRLPFPGWANLPSIRMDTNPFWEGLWILFRSFLWAAVGVLAILFFPKQTQRVAKAAISQPLISGGFGFLTLVVAPIVLVIMVITIIGIPVALLAVFALFIVWIFGVVALGTETGKRLSKVFNQEWSLAVSAGLGTFLLILVIEGINWVIPCVGWIGLLAVAVVGIGSVLLTRLGSQDYPRYEGISALESTPAEPGSEQPAQLMSAEEATAPTEGDDVDAHSDDWGPEEG